MPSVSPVLILGSGPAGCTAALYAARACLDPLVVRGASPQGQLMLTTDVDNYPGVPETQGPDLMQAMEEQARKAGALFVDDHITSVDFTASPFLCTGSKTYSARTVIIATGAQARWLGLESEKAFQGFGVSACATCDGFFFRGKRVLVVGGGNTAVEEALYLTRHASSVTLVHRRGELRAEKTLQKKLEASPVNMLWNTRLEEVHGDTAPRSVTGVTVRDLTTGEARFLPMEGVFIAIGHTPSTALFQGHVHMDPEGYIMTTHGSTRTNITGVFAAGDVCDKIYRQAVTAAGMGCRAALDAERSLS